MLQGSRKPSFSSLFSSQTTREPHEHRPGHDFAQKFDRCIPIAAACVGLRGCASHPRHPQSDSLFGGAGRNNRPLTVAPRGGRGPSLASSVALWCSLALVRYSIFFFENTLFLDRDPKAYFFTKFYSIHFFPTRLSRKRFSR